jgi:uncharacterized membrane-anchored protein
MKVLATTFGETAGDFVSQTLALGNGASSFLLVGLFVIALAFQMRAPGYRPFLFWTVIASTSTAGTTMADFVDGTPMQLGHGYGSLLLFGLLCTSLALWRITSGSVSVNDVRSPRDEYFYWFTILFSNTLGTATGDYLSNEAGLGYIGGTMVVCALLALIAAGYYFTNLSRVFLFWSAFVLTRPFGATFGNFLSKAKEKGGLEMGNMSSSLLLAGLLALVIYVDGKRTPGEPALSVESLPS